MQWINLHLFGCKSKICLLIGHIQFFLLRVANFMICQYNLITYTCKSSILKNEIWLHISLQFIDPDQVLLPNKSSYNFDIYYVTSENSLYR